MAALSGDVLDTEGKKIKLWRKFDEAAKENFLTELQGHGIIRDAAKAASVCFTTVYEHMRKDGAFEREVRLLQQLGHEALADQIESNLARQSDEGNVVAGIFLLKGLRPKYNDRKPLTDRNSTPIHDAVEDLDRLLAKVYDDEPTGAEGADDRALRDAGEEPGLSA